jgi:hypothetical protein
VQQGDYRTPQANGDGLGRQNVDTEKGLILEPPMSLQQAVAGKPDRRKPVILAFPDQARGYFGTPPGVEDCPDSLHAVD